MNIIKYRDFFRETSNSSILPKRATTGSAGFDLFVVEDFFMEGNSLKPIAVPMGFTVNIPQGHCYVTVNIRSGVALRDWVTLANSTGIIDNDYRKEVGLILLNFNWENVYFKRGDRIAQLITHGFIVDDHEHEKQMRTGGFGSTGI